MSRGKKYKAEEMIPQAETPIGNATVALMLALLCLRFGPAIRQQHIAKPDRQVSFPFGRPLCVDE